jgi:glycosyltransferase involved in cell wall biosynthesis
MTQPRVSILLPIRNGEPYLREAVQSVVDQTFTDWEMVAVLDGSTDGSDRVVESFQDSRIRLFRMAPPGGFPYTLNFGLKRCRAELVARMDQDDICFPNRLGRQVAAFDSRPALAVLGTSAQIVDESSKVVGERSVVTGVRRVGTALLWRNQLIHPSVMFRRKLILDLGGYDPASSPIFEDYELWLRVVSRGEVDNLGEPLLKYRRHSRQQSRGSRLFAQALATLSRSRREAGKYLGLPGFALGLLDLYWLLTQVVHRIFVVGWPRPGTAHADRG